MKKSDFKNLKCHPDLHKKIKVQSSKIGISVYALTEIGMKMVNRLSFDQLREIVMEDFSNESKKLLDGILNNKKQ